MKELEQKVVEWANERGIYELSTRTTRFEKLVEEVFELGIEIDLTSVSNPDIEKVKLEAGDVLVTLINLLHPEGLDLETCLAAAYEKISKRTGQMINGQFVRDKEK